uniref:Zinc fingers and homeoboxes protein 1 n=1 Tax=Amphiprion percula TaxID=161767 RepID=A0A3P8TMQ1_AMPPE
MSSRRKSTTPCMVLPSDVVEQEEVEEKAERTKEEDAGEDEEGKVKEGAEEEPTADELGQAVVVVPAPPVSGRTLFGTTSHEHISWTVTCQFLPPCGISNVDICHFTHFLSVFQVLSAFQAQQNTATAQPQLLIPLSSIPSYSAAMDTNPLLGTTYKKFPYPSMAEISSLAAQTQFTEEQIKVWFSAQRLKHGVSWTPEEVEEARRKQFNGTVHTVPQTITVIPAHQLSAAANGLQSILQTCQIVGQPGLVFTQVGKNITSPITLTVAGLPSQSQSSSRVPCQPTPTNSELKRATTVQPPSLSPQVRNSALSADTFNMRPKKSKEQLAELKASYLKNHFVTDAEIARLMKLTNLTKGEIKKWFSDTRYNQRNSKNSHTRSKTWNPFPDFTLQKFKEKTPEQLVVLEESFEKSSTPSDEEVNRLRTETKLTRREIDAWFTERRKMPSVSTSSPDSSEGGKMETDGAKALEGGGAGGATSSSPSDKSKKSPEQLHILKSAFVRTQWPTPEEYDQLAEESGLPRSYIVSWFGDSRYSWKNGNLKWFFQYQSGSIEGPNGGDVDRSPLSKKFKTGREILKEYYLKHQFLNEQDLDELVTKTNMNDEEDDGEETDDSEVWEPSRSVRKSLSVSED